MAQVMLEFYSWS